MNIGSCLDCHGVVNYHKPDTEGIESSFVHLTEFEMLTEQDVKSLMQDLSLKSCALDPMPSTLLSRCDVLLPVLTRLINMSLKSGQFPVACRPVTRGGCTGCVRTSPQAPKVRILILNIQVKACSRLN